MLGAPTTAARLVLAGMSTAYTRGTHLDAGPSPVGAAIAAVTSDETIMPRTRHSVRYCKRTDSVNERST